MLIGLRELLEESGKTQKEVATALGMSQQRFNFYVNGKREADYALLQRIADYFNVTVDFLMNGKKKDPPIPKDGGLSEDTLRVVEKFSRLTPENQQKVEEYMALLALKEDRQ